MPHQCTNCGRTFPDGSKEMLSGCPDCGGNRFQFAPGDAREDRGSSSADASDGTTTEAESSGGAVSRAADAVRGVAQRPAGWVSDDATTDEGDDRRDTDAFPEWPETARESADRDDSATAVGGSSGIEDETTADGVTSDEDAAQASARTDVVSPDELPPASAVPDREPVEPPEHGRVVSEPTSDDRPSLDELREELNDQFESIKIVRPGEYELNLMELYDREEQIISLQEDGRYVINVPDSWRESDED